MKPRTPIGCGCKFFLILVILVIIIVSIQGCVACTGLLV